MKLINKEKEAIKFIRNAEQLALQLSDEGFHVAFSGGKDSQVLYHLMELSGCKFTAHMQVTTVDPPQVMKFIRNNYPNVKLHLPKVYDVEKGIYVPTNMRKIILKHGILPMRNVRFCCQELKEQAGAGTCTCVGVRAAESSRRAKRKMVERYDKKKIPKNKPDLEIQGCKLTEKPKQQFDLFEVKKDTIVTCVRGDDKVIISPIFKWSDADVWNWIRGNNIEYCELYDAGFTRIGCMFCPMRSGKTKRTIELKMFERMAEKIYIRAIRELMQQGKYQEFDTAEDVFMWWISNSNRDEFLAKQTNKIYL